MGDINIEIIKNLNKITLFIIKPIKAYLKHYHGVPITSWQRILLTFINDVATGVIFFLSLYFVHILHMNTATAGLFISIYGIGTAVGGILGGRLTDKLSPYVITWSCLLIEAIVFLCMIKVQAVALLIPIEFILGIASYTFSTANKVCVLNSIKTHENIKLKVLSLFYASSNLGLGISAIIISYLEDYGFSYIFLLSSSILFISAISTSLFLRKQNIIKIKHEKNENIDVNQTSNQNQNKSVFWLILLCLFSIGLIIAQLSSTYPIYLSSTFSELGLTAVSIAFTLNSFMILALQTPVVNYFSNHNKIFMVGIGAFLMAAGMSLLTTAFTYLIVFASMIIYTFGEMIFFSMAQLVIYQHSDITKKGQSLGLFQSTYALSIIIGPSLGGYIYHHMGASVLWYCCGIIGLLCLLITFSHKKYDITKQC